LPQSAWWSIFSVEFLQQQNRKEMEWLNKILLGFHIVAGNLALICGLISMISKKGKLLHRRAGIIFFYSMIAVTISSIYLSIVKDIPFLLHIGIFVFYQTYNGWRTLKIKSQHPSIFDWILQLIALVNGIFMMVSMQIVLLVFGGISLFLVFNDVRLFINVYRGNAIPRMTWLVRHIGNMIGAFIGALSAFLVVNFSFPGPYWIVWLAPTIIFVPLMRYWTWVYTIKGNKKLEPIQVKNL
jgi:uncharacterized membrane protein